MLTCYTQLSLHESSEHTRLYSVTISQNFSMITNRPQRETEREIKRPDGSLITHQTLTVRTLEPRLLTGFLSLEEIRLWICRL